MTVQEIKDIIMEDAYDVYGLRIDNTDFSVGDICDNSHEVWQDDPEDGSEYNEEWGYWVGEELDGTCAVRVTVDTIEKALKKIDEYYGKNLYLISGYDYSWGNDQMEVIIRNAKVLKKEELL